MEGFAPHLQPWVLRRKMAVSIAKIDDFRADFLKHIFLDLWVHPVSPGPGRPTCVGGAGILRTVRGAAAPRGKVLSNFIASYV